MSIAEVTKQFNTKFNTDLSAFDRWAMTVTVALFAVILVGGFLIPFLTGNIDETFNMFLEARDSWVGYWATIDVPLFTNTNS